VSNGQNEQNDDEVGIIPEGRYPVACTDATLGYTSEGNPQIGISLVIADGEYSGRFLAYYGYFTPKTTEHTIKGMRALGWKGHDMTELGSMIGKSGTVATAVVEHEADRDGKMRARVRWINGAGVAMKDKMNPAQQAEFAARMRRVAMASETPDNEGGGDGRRLPSTNRDDRDDRGGYRGSDRSDNRGQRQLPSTARRDDVPPPGEDDRPPYERGRGYQDNRR
jgi:hypothetical protein